MFTGLVEDVGTVKLLKPAAGGAKLSVESALEGVKEGDSVAVNGACLTVTYLSRGVLEFDVSDETLKRTNLRFLKPRDRVNLERALTLSKPLGGHLVQGHVDTVGKILELRPRGEHYLLKVGFDPKFDPFVVEKGSIAVDGISLTVNAVGDGWAEINVIPHTYKNTNLQYRRVGDPVNLEFDLIGKYVISYLKRAAYRERLLKNFLR